MTIDLNQLAINAGMTQEEFVTELGRSYATYISLMFDMNPRVTIIQYKVDFIDHSIIIESHRQTSLNLALN